MKVYGMFTQFRHGDSVGEMFLTEHGRQASLLAFVEEFADDDEIGDEPSVSELLECCAAHDHDVHVFDQELEVEAPKPVQSARVLAAIIREMDGKEWNADTLEAIAGHLRTAGYELREP